MFASKISGFVSRPVVRAAATSAVVMSCGDMICQTIQHKSAGRDVNLDLKRTARFGIVGLTLHGPFFFNGFRMLDARFGTATNMQKVLTKVAAGQVTLFPLYTAAFFTYMGLLEGSTPQQIQQRFQTAFMPTMITGSGFWPLVNIFNFKFVPATHRVLYVNACGLVWNAYLSWINTQ